MSQKGILLAAEAFSQLQQIRGQLMKMGRQDAGTKAGNQDIRLAQLLDTAKDAEPIRYSHALGIRLRCRKLNYEGRSVRLQTGCTDFGYVLVF